MIWSQFTISEERASELVKSAGHDLSFLLREDDVLLGNVILTVYRKKYTLAVPAEYCHKLRDFITPDDFCEVYERDRPEDFSYQRYKSLHRGRGEPGQKQRYEVCRFCWARPPITDDGRCEFCLHAKAHELEDKERNLSRMGTEFIGRKVRSSQVLGGTCELNSDGDG